MVLVLSRGGFCPRSAGRMKGLLNSIVSSRLPIAGWSRLAPTISLGRMSIGAESAPTGPSSLTRGVSSKKISTSPNTLILFTIPWSPPRDCPRARSCHLQDLQRLLVVRPTHYGRPPPGPTCRYKEMSVGLGHHNARTQRAWQQGRNELFYPYGKTRGGQD
jgi:hypothetical protein